LAGCFVAPQSKTTACILPPRAAHPAKFAAALLYEPQTWCTSSFSCFYICTFSGRAAPDRAGARPGARPYQSQRHRLIKSPKLGFFPEMQAGGNGRRKRLFRSWIRAKAGATYRLRWLKAS
jgi:hypothetical protein